MSGKQFIPNIERVEVDEVMRKADNVSVQSDKLSVWMLNAVKVICVSLFILIPVFFMPGLWATLGFGKTMLAIFAGGISIVLLSFAALRSRSASTVLPLTLLFYIAFLVASFVSAIMVGDTQDSIRGTYIDVQTVGFMGVMGLMMLIPLTLQSDKKFAKSAIAAFLLSAGLIMLYNLIRLFAGPDFLSFASFNNLTASPVGTFNDLAIFASLTILVSIISLIQLSLNKIVKIALSLLIFASLLILTVVNFFDIWLIVGFFSLITLVYLLSKDILFSENTKAGQHNLLVMIIAAVIFIVSTTFVVAVESSGELVDRIFDVEYVEVTPSREGTLGIARNVFEESALLGIGPNRFSDAWRLYREPQIVQTIFWETDFESGSGFVSTLVINNGLIGGALFLLFHLSFLVFGYRLLMKGDNSDKQWYFIGLVSFSSAAFIWMLSYLYEPGQSILILGALFTGLSLASGAKLLPSKIKNIPLITNQRRGFAVMAVAIIMVSSIVVIFMGSSKQYLAQAQFNQARSTAITEEQVKSAAESSYQLYQDDRFVRTSAQVDLATINVLLSLAEPSDQDLQNFTSLIAEARSAVNQAVSQDPSNPDNYAVSASIYQALLVAGVNGAKELVESEIAKAQALDPLNPGYSLLLAQVDIRSGAIESAREKIQQSLELKSNYTEALFLLAQIDIREGDTEAAIDTTRSIISLEPQNPTRYFQLGMLLSSEEQTEEAVVDRKSTRLNSSHFRRSRMPSSA